MSAADPTIIRVFPRQTSATPRDALAFIGDPPLFRPEADEVHVSCTFTWDVPEAKRLERAWAQFYPTVRIGGPAIDTQPPGHFTAGLYVRRGITITTRGCPNQCSFCLVPDREGRLTELPIMPGNEIQDNNLLAASRRHVEAVFGMLREQPRGARFTGGLDATRFRLWHRDLLQSIRVRDVWFAYDMPHREGDARLAIRTCTAGGLSRRKVRCYVLIGRPGDTVCRARSRLESVWSWGALPFAMLYQPLDRFRQYARPWRDLAREWTRPAAMFAAHKEQQPT